MTKERQGQQTTLVSISRQVEDTILTCEALRKGQEHLNARLHRLEPPIREAHERTGCGLHELRQKVSDLRDVAPEPDKVAAQLSRRLQSIDPVVEEGKRLWLETYRLRGLDQRHDLQ